MKKTELTRWERRGEKRKTDGDATRRGKRQSSLKMVSEKLDGEERGPLNRGREPSALIEPYQIARAINDRQKKGIAICRYESSSEVELTSTRAQERERKIKKITDSFCARFSIQLVHCVDKCLVSSKISARKITKTIWGALVKIIRL